MLPSFFMFAVACSPELPATASQPPDPRAKAVLVVYNANAPEARVLTDEYVSARGVPKSNILALKVTTSENIAKSDYKSGIVEPVKKAIARLGSRIDFILMVRGLPIRLDHDYGHSVDASLMVDAHPARAENPLDWWAGPKQEGGSITIEPRMVEKYVNPYGGADEAFDSSKFSMYLVTRLEAYTVGDARELISRSIDAKPLKGPFLLDSAPDRGTGGYGAIQRWMDPAQSLLERKSINVIHDESKLFIGDKSGLMGYASWGSNDPAYALSLY